MSEFHVGIISSYKGSEINWMEIVVHSGWSDIVTCDDRGRSRGVETGLGRWRGAGLVIGGGSGIQPHEQRDDAILTGNREQVSHAMLCSLLLSFLYTITIIICILKNMKIYAGILYYAENIIHGCF